MLHTQGKMGGLSWMLGILIVMVGVIGFFLIKPSLSQTALPSGGCTTNEQCPAGTTCNAGSCITTITTTSQNKAASVQLAAFDQAPSAGRAQRGDVRAYVWELDAANDASSGTRILVQAGTVLSTTARTSISSSTGKWLWAVAFNESTDNIGGNVQPTGSYAYYGELKKNVKIESETPQLDLNIWRSPTSRAAKSSSLANNVTISIFKDGTGVVLREPGAGSDMSINASGSATVTADKIRIRNNEANTVFRIGAIIFNTTAAMPVDYINLESGDFSGLTKTDNLRRMSGSSRLTTYRLATPRMLPEFQEVNTGGLQIHTTGACGTTALPIQINIVDWAEFVKKDGSYGEGLEDDANSPTDVGIADLFNIITCATS